MSLASKFLNKMNESNSKEIIELNYGKAGENTITNSDGSVLKNCINLVTSKDALLTAKVDGDLIIMTEYASWGDSSVRLNTGSLEILRQFIKGK